MTLIKNLPENLRWAAVADHVRYQVRIEVDTPTPEMAVVEGQLLTIARVYLASLAPVAVVGRHKGADLAISLSKIRTIKRIGLGS